MNFSNFVFWLLFVLALSAGTTKCCPDMDIESCSDHIYDSETVFDTVNGKTLSEACRQKDLLFHCFQKMISNCHTKESNLKPYHLLTEELQKIVGDLCRAHSQLGRDLVDNAACIHNLRNDSDEWFACYTKSPFTSHTREMHCCEFFENVDCKVRLTDKHCGPVAAHLVAKLLPSVYGEYMVQTCKNYSRFCKSKGSYIGTSYPVVLSTFVLSLTLFHSKAM